MINDFVSFVSKDQRQETNDYIYISALNHYEYCPTRCYWIYIAGEFQDNEYTVEGDIIHENVHKTMKTTRGDLVQLRRVHVYSKKYGLIGFTDLIEEKAGEIYPVEYKRGRRGDWKNDKLQLCAQALCLEEMCSPIGEPSLVVSPLSFDEESPTTKDEGPKTRIPKGFIYYASSGRRVEVVFDDELRKYTVVMIEKVRELMKSGLKPPAFYKSKCAGCSLYPVCLPKEEEKARRAKLDFGL
jgi:CRISPR-associated exonuclease Cas4